ncbi:MAG: T9SS type A sorting domain-containing protein, partial [Algibacter sp.]
SSITANTDGSLLIPREYLSTLTPEKQVSLRQQSGTAGSSTITFTNTIFGDSLVDEEFEILKKLYNSTNGAFWTNIWDISQNNLNLSSWYGVSIEDGHVISIDLFNNNLSGVIPEEISGLKYLKTLTLNSNNISGNIPANINLLTDLESLDLSSNLLSGTIPTVISELQQLKKFSIGNNNFGGTIPTVLSDFIALEYLDISSNSFNKVEKKLYYDFTNTYIDLRNQTINSNTQLNLEEDQFKVELGNIVKYDLENNNYNAKNNFVLLVNDVIHTSTITNELGEVIFENVRIGEIPSDAKISIRQTTGTFRNTQFNFTGIEDKSDIPVLEQEYLALVDLYNQLNGDEWFNKWDVSSNNLHTNKWFGVSIYDGHVVAINLSLNNVTGIVPDIFNNLPYLNTLNLSSNKLTGVAAILPSAIDFLYYKQVIELGEVDLNRDTTVNDLNINRYDHSKRGYFNQTYNLRIGSFSKTVNLSEEGVRLIDLISMWKIPDNQILELRQVSGNATNSILSYYLKYQSGDSNLDSRLNILDLQTSINYYLGDNIDYFNYNATDINSDNSINILDLVKQVDIIQSQESVSTGKFSASIKSKTNNINAKISIENGKLLLDTKGNTVTSFEILIDNTSQELVEELVSNTGFTVSLKNRNNQVSFLAYSFDSSLNGVIELAKFNSNKPYIKAVILSDINAQEIPSEIVQAILAIDDLDIKEVSIAFNIPNPFQIETTISFLSNDNGNKAILSIFELSGRMVEKIELGNLVQGENSYVFKRKKLSSGIYLYKIASDDNKVIAKGKMTIK